MNKLRRIDSDSVKSCDLVAVYTHGGPGGREGTKKMPKGLKKEGGREERLHRALPNRARDVPRSLPMRPWQI